MPARGPQQTPRSAPTGVSPAPSRAGGRWKWQTKFCQHPTPRMGTPEGTRPRSGGVCGGPGPHVWAAAPHRGDPLCSSQPRRGESGPHMQAQRPARGWPLTTQAAGLLSGSRARPHLIWKAAGTGVAGSDRRLPECTGAWNAGRAWLSPEVLGCSQPHATPCTPPGFASVQVGAVAWLNVHFLGGVSPCLLRGGGTVGPRPLRCGCSDMAAVAQ